MILSLVVLSDEPVNQSGIKSSAATGKPKVRQGKQSDLTVLLEMPEIKAEEQSLEGSI